MYYQMYNLCCFNCNNKTIKPFGTFTTQIIHQLQKNRCTSLPPDSYNRIALDGENENNSILVPNKTVYWIENYGFWLIWKSWKLLLKHTTLQHPTTLGKLLQSNLLV